MRVPPDGAGVALAATALGAAAVVAFMGGTALLTTPGAGPQEPHPPAASDGPAPVPAGARLVGLGNVAIAVPEGLGTNQTRCGTPQKDTVVINVGAVEACAVARPEGVDSVELVQGEPRFDFRADSAVQIDGDEAQRQRTTCTRDTIGGVRVCSGTVYFPADATWFRAESSTGPEAVDRRRPALLIGIMSVLWVGPFRTQRHALMASVYENSPDFVRRVSPWL